MAIKYGKLINIHNNYIIANNFELLKTTEAFQKIYKNTYKIWLG